MSDLSLQNSMIERNCNGIECKDCPFSIGNYSQLGCIDMDSGTGIYAIVNLANVLEIDVSRVIQILNNELAHTFIDDYDYELLCESKFPPGASDYFIISILQIQELLSIAIPVIKKFQTVFEENSNDYINELWYDKVFKEFEVYGEYLITENQIKKFSIFNRYITVVHAYQFLEKALAMNKPVELGRFDFKYRFQYL
jgi:hypothetical protein